MNPRTIQILVLIFFGLACVSVLAMGFAVLYSELELVK